MKLPAPGELFESRYRLESILGEGGFATVFGARDEADRILALNVLKPDGPDCSLDTRSRFTREVATSYRSGQASWVCTPARPVRYVVIEASRSERMPYDGGAACGFRITKLSVEQARGVWIERNTCSGEPRRTNASKHGFCLQYDCEIAFTSCEAHGGHGWPGGTEDLKKYDPAGCDDPPSSFGASDVIGEFLASLEPS